MPEIRRPAPPMYSGISLRRGSIPPGYLSFLTAMAQPNPAEDPLARLSDNFSGNALNPSWSIFNPELLAATTVADGQLNIRITAGGAAGSFWYNNFDGTLIYKTVSGACDMRARCHVRNAANSGNPPASNSRVGVIAAHDPLRPPTPDATYNYVHAGEGTVDGNAGRDEWKTTDLSVSTYAASPFPPNAGLLDGDIRIIRRPDNLQIFETYIKTMDTPLADEEHWELLQVLDRSSNTQPARADSRPMPLVLQWGMSVYSSEVVHDVQMFVDEVIFATPRAA